MQQNNSLIIHLVRIVEIKDPDTVKNYLKYIESTYLLSQAMRFDWSVKKQIGL